MEKGIGMEAKFTIPGKAIPKARPRVTRAGYAYTPRTTQQFEQLVRIAYKNQCGNFEFPKGAPLLMNIEFCFEPPKSWPKQKREKAIQRKKYPTARPDLDNLWKAVADALNGIAYNDDSRHLPESIRREIQKQCSNRHTELLEEINRVQLGTINNAIKAGTSYY